MDRDGFRLLVKCQAFDFFPDGILGYSGEDSHASFEDANHEWQELLGTSQLAVVGLPTAGHDPDFPFLKTFLDHGDIVIVKPCQYVSVVRGVDFQFPVLPEMNCFKVAKLWAGKGSEKWVREVDITEHGIVRNLCFLELQVLVIQECL